MKDANVDTLSLQFFEVIKQGKAAAPSPDNVKIFYIGCGDPDSTPSLENPIDNYTLVVLSICY